MKLIPYARTLNGDTQTPILLYLNFVGDGKGFLLESREQPKGRYSMLAKNPYIEVYSYKDEVTIIKEGNTTKVQGKILEIVQQEIGNFEVTNTLNMPFVGGAVGAIGYDVIRQYERLENVRQDQLGLPEAHLMFVKEVVVYDHYSNKIFAIVLEEPSVEGESRANILLDGMVLEIEQTKQVARETAIKPLTEFTSNFTKEAYMNAVEKSKHYIHEGDIFQVVISQRFEGTTEMSSFDMYRQLRQINPTPYMFYFNYLDYQIVGSSPEMLVELRNDVIKNCPIAGTRKRGKDEIEDIQLEKDLLKDEKEIAEHMMLVDLGRNDMGRVSQIGSVEVVELMKVKYYSHVMHISSLVEGMKRKDKSMFEVLMSFLPAGTLSGAPKIRAMEIIDELEPVKRGFYGGAIGYFGFDGNMDMCIAIRTIIKKDKKVYMQAGAGLVADSDPETEYEESYNKAKALLTIFNHD